MPSGICTCATLSCSCQLPSTQSHVGPTQAAHRPGLNGTTNETLDLANSKFNVPLEMMHAAQADRAASMIGITTGQAWRVHVFGDAVS